MSEARHRFAAQQMLHIIEFAHRDCGCDVDVDRLIVHWLTSPIPTERLVAVFLSDYVTMLRKAGHTGQFLVEALVDLDAGVGGGPAVLAPHELLAERTVWVVFVAAYVRWETLLEGRR